MLLVQLAAGRSGMTVDVEARPDAAVTASPGTTPPTPPDDDDGVGSSLVPAGPDDRDRVTPGEPAGREAPPSPSTPSGGATDAIGRVDDGSLATWYDVGAGEEQDR